MATARVAKEMRAKRAIFTGENMTELLKKESKSKQRVEETRSSGQE
jgi:hypothetical protein